MGVSFFHPVCVSACTYHFPTVFRTGAGLDVLDPVLFFSQSAVIYLLVIMEIINTSSLVRGGVAT